MKENTIRTDLAVEIRESLDDDAKGLEGVTLEIDDKSDTKITRVIIRDEKGADAMKKPVGTYITIESDKIMQKYNEEQKEVIEHLVEEIKSLLFSKKDEIVNSKGRELVIMLAGLGNREATPDALGPKVAEKLYVSRNLVKKSKYRLCAIAPGVMGQTGMESIEILRGLVNEIRPDCIIIVDALAARSIHRLNTTIQLTDTGICPGSGVGNNRKEINSNNLGVKVISIGVPTVIDAGTIIRDSLNISLREQNFSDYEVNMFLSGLDLEKMHNLYVAPKDIDEAISNVSNLISDAINHCFSE